MKKIFYIAKNELYTLFYSPIAWILLILFLVMTSVDYIFITDLELQYFERGGMFLQLTENLTSFMTSHIHLGYLPKLLQNLYIFFPLITMGLISREINGGTIKLLYSSPLKISEIVMGKFLATVCFSIILIILLLFTMVGLSLSVSHPDYLQMLTAVLGIFLVLCAYAAIGLFISSLTSYQIVAAIITLGIFALLANIGQLYQNIDIVRDVTYYLNIGAKAHNFLTGLLDLRDFIYFLLITVSFLLFTIIRIRSATESISLFRKAYRYIIVVLVAFVIGYITNKPTVNVYHDATRDKLQTITPTTQNMLKKLNDGELEITVVANLFDIYYGSFYTPSERNDIITDLWEPYIRFKPDIKVKFINYYDADTSSYYVKSNPGKSLKEIAEKETKIYGLSIDKFLGPDEINQLVNTRKEEFRSFFLLKYKGKTTVVRVFDDPWYWPFESEIAAAINRLIAVPPKIAFLSDEIERGPFSERTRDYQFVSSKVSNRIALINQGYDFDTISLKEKPVPSGLAAFVIADPRTPIQPEEIAKIDHYIDSGGNLFIACEPDRKDIIKPILNKLGLSLREGILIQPNGKFSSDCTFPYLTPAAKNISPLSRRFIKDQIIYHSDSTFRVAMVGASAIDFREIDGFHIEPLLRTSQYLSWNRLAAISNDSLQLKTAKLPNDEQGSFVTALRMDRTINGKQQRIIVAGDADYLSSSQIQGYEPTRYNKEFGFWCFSVFTYGEFPPNNLRPKSLDNSFKIKSDNIAVQKMIYYWILPMLIAIACSVILIRRKRK